MNVLVLVSLVVLVYWAGGFLYVATRKGWN
jgi:hypothetical protein